MQVLKEDIRGRILAVAEQRFGQQGYSKTSMREIAGAVGVGVGNIYKVGSINSIFYFLHKAAEPFNCLEQDNLA